ncbi:hypothetical protein [Sphingobacterium sp.]|uniref:hypothetical protein n=1 Tax=Sphingobacterium sp. TaxID=341027 RepID=UPI002FD89BE2
MNFSSNSDKQYSDFNFWVFDYYCERNYKGEPGCLAIDEYDYNESGFRGVFFPEIYEGNWSKLFGKENNHNIPLFFGLIGLQCLAAIAVENNHIRDEFKVISGIKNLQSVDQYFSEPFANHTIQDEFWVRVKNYLKDYLEIDIEIPKPKKRKDRFIQYPKSQVVLNRDDLKEYKPFLDNLHEKLHYEPISLSDFKKEILGINRPFLRKNNRNQERTDIQEKIRLRQVFNYYNSDSWISDELAKRIYERESNHSYTLIFDGDNGNIIITDGLNNSCSPLSVLERRNNKYCFFQKHDVFSDEFTLVKNLEYNRDYIILYEKDKFRNWASGIEICYDNSLKIGFKYIFYENPESIDPYEFAKHFDLKHKPIQLVGLRIGGRNVFMENLGPKIVDKDYTVYLNGRRIEYKPNNCEPGEYRVRVNREGIDYSDIRFRIIDTYFYNYKYDDIERRVLGSRLDSLKLCNIGNRMVGIKYVCDDKSDNNQLNLNDWIKANTDQQSKNNKNRFLNLIRKNKNGD